MEDEFDQYYNHERPQSLMGLANARRDSNIQLDEIIRLSEANVRPRQIIPLLDESNLLKKGTCTI
jgi:hypothetical protein